MFLFCFLDGFVNRGAGGAENGDGCKCFQAGRVNGLKIVFILQSTVQSMCLNVNRHKRLLPNNYYWTFAITNQTCGCLTFSLQLLVFSTLIYREEVKSAS